MGNAPSGFRMVQVGVIPLQKEGDSLQGIYKGKGKPRKVKNKSVDVYLVQTEDGIVEVLGSHNIAAFLDAQKVGTEVYIERGATVKGGAHGKVNTYKFGVRET